MWPAPRHPSAWGRRQENREGEAGDLINLPGEVPHGFERGR